MLNKEQVFNPGEHFSSFIREQLKEGRYASETDVILAGLRLLEEQEAKMELLRNALIEGETSGAATPFDFETFIAQKKTAQ